MRRKKASPETIGSVFEFFFQTDEMSPATISWPPDAFCFAASVLQKSAAYTSLVGDDKPVLGFKHKEKDRANAIESIAIQWRDLAGAEQSPPLFIKRWIGYIKAKRDVPLGSIASHKKLLAALVNLMAAADEACFSLGIW
jgi:hypothetical protein